MAEDTPATPRRQQGTSRDYLIDRLRRAGRTDFLDAIERGEISAHTAAIEMGWIKRASTVVTITPQARRRRLRLEAIADGGLSPSQAQELWLGPNPTQGSLFSSREELVQAWTEHRDVLMARWGSHGRRPMIWWELDAGDLEHPGYFCERSYLYEHNVLSESERAEVEVEWRRDFEAAKGKSARERREAYRFADIPLELVERWQGERRRRPKPRKRDDVALIPQPGG